MVTGPQGEGVSSLPTEMWTSILVLAKEPAARSVCKLFDALYSDPTVILEVILPDLKRRGIEVEFPLGTTNEVKLQKIKSVMADRLFRVVSPTFHKKCNQASSLSLATFIRIFKEEEAIALNQVFERIAPILFASLTLDPEVFIKTLPANPIDRAEQIRAFLTDHLEMAASIDTLDLKGLKLTVVPDELRLFTSLKKIDLSDNKLTKLPASFGQAWRGLEECRLDYNSMVTLPEGFGRTWSRLNKFTMVHNKLESLPEDFGSAWSEIGSLDLNFNQLVRLPQNFGKGWCKCESIAVDSNKLADIPDSLPKRCPELKFLRVRTNPVDPLFLNQLRTEFQSLLALL